MVKTLVVHIEVTVLCRVSPVETDRQEWREGSVGAGMSDLRGKESSGQLSPLLICTYEETESQGSVPSA